MYNLVEEGDFEMNLIYYYKQKFFFVRVEVRKIQELFESKINIFVLYMMIVQNYVNKGYLEMLIYNQVYYW